MTCMKITVSQNGQIYPKDTFSNGAAHIYIYTEGYSESTEPIYAVNIFPIFPLARFEPQDKGV